MSTTVTGVIPVLDLDYTVTLEPGRPPELPTQLIAVLPPTGTPLGGGPGVPGPAVFDPRDPAAVYAWLLLNTELCTTRGPSLLHPTDQTPEGAVH